MSHLVFLDRGQRLYEMGAPFEMVLVGRRGIFEVLGLVVLAFVAMKPLIRVVQDLGQDR
jgi:hypothetical protein